MTDRKPPRDPLTPPPLPPRQQVRPHTSAPASQPVPPPLPPASRPQPRFDNVRPGFDRPEDRPRTLGQPAQRQPVRPQPQRPAYDPNVPPVGRTSRSEPGPRRGGWGGLIALGLGLLLVLPVSAIAYLAYAPPEALLRDQIIAQVKAKTSRDLTIGGPVTLNYANGLALSMRDLTLSGPPSMGSEPLASAAEVSATVNLWPLLWRQISVKRLVLREPIFNLRTDAKGKRSWDIADLAPAALVQYAQGPAAPASTMNDAGLPDAVKDFVSNASDPDNPSPQIKAKLARLEELTLGSIHIENGTVRYRDDRNGANTAITALDTSIALPSLASPLDASGKLDYLGLPLAFTIKLASPKAIIQDRPAKLTLAVNAETLAFNYDGSVTARSTIDLEGAIAAKSPSLRAVTAWLGHELPPSDGFGPVSLAGTVKSAGSSYTVSLGKAELDAAAATGTLSLDAAGARPRVTANLKITELDLNRYSLAAGRPVAVKQPAIPAMPATPPASSIEDLLNGGAPSARPGPQVKGYTRRAGWSQDRIELGALGALDLDARLAVGRLLYRDLKVGASQVTLALKGKVLKANFDDVQLYDGHGRGYLTIDAGSEPPVVAGNMSVDGVTAATILKDAAGVESIAGSGRITLALGAKGNTEAELIATTNGKADLAFTNGAIVGYNVPATLRSLMQGKFAGLDRTPTEKTDFSDLTATFTVANGVASNQDMKLSGPVLRATGAGQVQLPALTVDFTVKPKVSLPGQSSINEALSGIDVPLRITGPLEKPSVNIDKVGVANAPKTIEAVKEIGRQLKDNDKVKQLGTSLKGLLKDNPDGTKANAKSIFDKLLKKKEPAAAN